MGREYGVTHGTEDGLAVVRVQGEIDLMTADALRDELCAAVQAAPVVMVDLSGVGFLDSTGVRSLFDAYKCAADLGHHLYVRDAQQWVAKVLDVTGVGRLLTPPAPKS
ncbi:STAS domain-containing protein [Catellatospora sp. KI3]|uniref:STAS domain-containing protein n=1 Tax=Catellatospora sp. KI3 TaxID=3041620 RepID=UPI0024823E6E|nr:STAS domain-containing protein [Catellatospora sp. KI3]MDI1462680.1 STAS domain-containing protein [Catellatospora sp. KI3]